MTVFAIGVSGLAILLFGGFVTSIWFSLQTSIVQEQGHVQLFKRGYTDFGAADPDAYTISDYGAVTRSIMEVPELRQQIAVITPQILLGGIAGNSQEDNSKTFMGKGVVPSDYNRMRSWDSWNLGIAQHAVALRDDDVEGAITGVGMARMIGLCNELKLAECKDPPARVSPSAGASAESADFSHLLDTMPTPGAAGTTQERPRLDLLAATSGGAPNIVSVFVNSAMTQSIRAVDNSMVMLHFDQARKLLYGHEPKATAILIQAVNPDATATLKADLARHLASRGFDMEVLSFDEVDPTFNRILGMFSFIFGVVSLVLAIVIVFTIVNTATMNVMERVNEIGTVRAMGFRQGNVFRQFLAESFLLGLGGALLATVLATVVSMLLNDAGIQWTPPNNAAPMTIRLMVTDNLLLMAATVACLVLVTVAASALPALRAVRFPIVKALHHA